jgi:hypothetical protein
MDAIERNLSTAGAALAFVIVCSVLLYMTIQTLNHSKGKVDYCYMEHLGGFPEYWTIFGHVPWRGDLVISRETDFEKAVDIRDNKCGVVK